MVACTIVSCGGHTPCDSPILLLSSFSVNCFSWALAPDGDVTRDRGRWNGIVLGAHQSNIEPNRPWLLIESDCSQPSVPFVALWEVPEANNLPILLGFSLSTGLSAHFLWGSFACRLPSVHLPSIRRSDLCCLQKKRTEQGGGGHADRNKEARRRHREVSWHPIDQNVTARLSYANVMFSWQSRGARSGEWCTGRPRYPISADWTTSETN